MHRCSCQYQRRRRRRLAIYERISREKKEREREALVLDQKSKMHHVKKRSLRATSVHLVTSSGSD